MQTRLKMSVPGIMARLGGRVERGMPSAEPPPVVGSLIADALLVRGISAEVIMSSTRRQVHGLTPFAKVRGTTITYLAEVLASTPKQLSAKRARLRPIKTT